MRHIKRSPNQVSVTEFKLCLFKMIIDIKPTQVRNITIAI